MITLGTNIRCQTYQRSWNVAGQDFQQAQIGEIGATICDSAASSNEVPPDRWVFM